MKLIDKSAVVAEIEKYISNYKGILNKVDKSSDDWVTSTLMLESKIDILQHILFFINTLEVKEIHEDEDIDVDLNPLFEEFGVEPNSRIASMFKEAFYKGVDKYLNKKESKL